MLVLKQSVCNEITVDETVTINCTRKIKQHSSKYTSDEKYGTGTRILCNGAKPRCDASTDATQRNLAVSFLCGILFSGLISSVVILILWNSELVCNMSYQPNQNYPQYSTNTHRSTRQSAQQYPITSAQRTGPAAVSTTAAAAPANRTPASHATYQTRVQSGAASVTSVNVPTPTVAVAKAYPPPPPPAALLQAVDKKPVLSELLAPGDILETDVPMTDSTENGEKKKKPYWSKFNKGGVKISKAVKRRRMNARLRRILQPRSPITILLEIRSGSKIEVAGPTGALHQQVFVASVEVDGRIFHGQGSSSSQAKQNVAERALKSLLLEKVCVSVAEVKNESEDVAMDENPSTEGEDGVTADGTTARPPRVIPEDDTPWNSLASYAIYRLLNEWRSQGEEIPDCLLNPSFLKPKEDHTDGADLNKRGTLGAMQPMRAVPPNPTSRHPVMLLNQLRPGVVFQHVAEEGTAPATVIFTIQVCLDDQTFQGKGRNKKEARKEAAKAALQGLYQITYPADDQPDVAVAV